MIMAIHNGWNLYQYDVKNAFVHADIDKEIYVEQPTGFFDKQKTKVCKLYKALYGLKQSPRLWYKHLYTILKQLGFTTFPYDEAIFIHTTLHIFLICHVDDFIVTGPDNTEIEQVIQKLNKSLKIQYLGEINQFLGMEFKINKEQKSLSITQIKYLNKLKARFKKESLTPVSTPVELGVQLVKSTEQAKEEDTIRYQQQVGALLYLAINTRPDISYAVNRCARYMSNPNNTHFRALDRIWKYLNHYNTEGLFYDCNNINLIGYSDSDWGGDTITRKSTTGYIFLLGKGNVISWNSMLQKTVALSSCEAEYMALKEAIKENIYLKNMITYITNLLQMQYMEPILLVDNQSAIKLAENPEFHKKSKHIDIIYHFIRQSIEEKKITIGYIPTKEQIADGFTKGLDNIKHKKLMNNTTKSLI